jgi:hypothetical protein
MDKSKVKVRKKQNLPTKKILPPPDAKTLIDQSLGIILVEVGKLSAVSALGQLSPVQAKTLTDYIKVLVSVDRNSRMLPEIEDNSISDLTDEELLAEAKKAIAITKKAEIK